MQKSQLTRVLSESNKLGTPFKPPMRVISESSSTAINPENETQRLTLLVQQLKKENNFLKLKVKELENEDLNFFKARINKLEKLIYEQDQQLQIQKVKSYKSNLDSVRMDSQTSEKQPLVQKVVKAIQQELQTQQLYSQDVHDKYALLIQERNGLQAQLDISKKQIGILQQKIEELTHSKLDETEQSDQLYQEYQNSQEAVLTLLKQMG